MGNRGVEGVKLSAIVGLETTTYCNRDCPWCLNYTLPAKDMSEDVFNASVSVLQQFKPGIIALSGCGEPLMDPDIVDRVAVVSSIGYLPVLYTNGDMVDEGVILGELKRAGLHKMFISRHEDEDDVVKLANSLGTHAESAYSPAVGGRTHNWAGQLDDINELKNVCNPLRKGWGYINVDGYITQCCLDYDAKYPICHVSDGGITDMMCNEIPLCKDCTGSP